MALKDATVRIADTDFTDQLTGLPTSFNAYAVRLRPTRIALRQTIEQLAFKNASILQMYSQPLVLNQFIELQLVAT
ncbi:MAG: hypothetical protein EB036_03430 [Betaproteobacteria bacterium]|nr:hypothetical protein [Betaproteobacteria bacterium]